MPAGSSAVVPEDVLSVLMHISIVRTDLTDVVVYQQGKKIFFYVVYQDEKNRPISVSLDVRMY